MMSEMCVGEILDSFRGLGCWRVGLAYGSLTYFDFGRKLVQPTARGRTGEIGEATLWLQGDDWRIERNDDQIASSASVDRETIESHVSHYFIGREIERILFGDASITVGFDTHLSVIAWRPRGATIGIDDALVKFFLPDGRIARFTESAGLFFTGEVHEIRQAAHRMPSVEP